MPTRPHALISLAGLVAIAISAIAGGWWLRNAKIDPATASRGQVLRQLAWAELSQESLAAQEAWVDRLQVELRQKTAEAPTPVALSADYRARLQRNIELLQRVWFRARTAQYVKLPAAEREQFLLEQLEVVAAWGQAASLFDAAPSPPDEALRAMIAKLDAWTTEAEGDEHAAMVAAINDATLCWLATADVCAQTPLCRRELAQRFALELERGASVDTTSVVTDAAGQARLRQNAAQLVEDYVHTLAMKFAGVAKAERAAFIDEQLSAVERWNIGQLMATATNSADASAALLAQSQVWIDHAPEDERDEVSALVSAVAQRLLWRKFQR